MLDNGHIWPHGNLQEIILWSTRHMASRLGALTILLSMTFLDLHKCWTIWSYICPWIPYHMNLFMNNPIWILILWWLLKKVRETFLHSQDDCLIVVWKIRKKNQKMTEQPEKGVAQHWGNLTRFKHFSVASLVLSFNMNCFFAPSLNMLMGKNQLLKE